MNDVPDKPTLLLSAAVRLMEPLARLLVANGVTYTMFAQALKRVFLSAADSELKSDGKRITDSALSLLSGVHRKDVRVLTAPEPPLRRTVTIASQVTMAWTTQPEYLDDDGRPRPLPLRSSDESGPSFERLSQGISKDFHSRSVLDELIRLGVVQERNGLAHLVLAEGFLPSADLQEMARYLAANIGDHIAAAATNFTASHKGRRTPFLEFALWGDELSAESIARLQAMAQQQWVTAMKKVRNAAEVLSEQDRALPAASMNRFRFGVYFYHQQGFEPTAGNPADGAVPDGTVVGTTAAHPQSGGSTT